jgi:hypothetical protein
MIEKSPAIEALLFQYIHLPLGGKKIRCPYWMDKNKKGIVGPFGGKGTPEQIVEATLMAAKKKGINLSVLSPSQIKAFMKKSRIGIDCSGLVFNLLDALDREKNGNGLADDIPGARGKLLVRASVKMLTDNKVALSVKKASEIQVGDMIRMNGRRYVKHVAVIVRIKKDAKGRIKEITYAHSSPRTMIKGVHLGKIRVKNEAGGLEDQEWLEKTREGENYGKFVFSALRGDGIRRLKILDSRY